MNDWTEMHLFIRHDVLTHLVALARLKSRFQGENLGFQTGNLCEVLLPFFVKMSLLLLLL
jgi:hypothetical protein